MSKKCYRFFGGLLNAQAKWLNKMSEKGYRLVRTGRVLYEFEECSPDEVTYCVEFIGEKSNDGKPFELHTSYADKEKYYRNLRNPWLFLLLLFALFAITKHSIVLGIFSLVSAIPSILYQFQIINVRQKAKTWEQ